MSNNFWYKCAETEKSSQLTADTIEFHRWHHDKIKEFEHEETSGKIREPLFSTFKKCRFTVQPCLE